MYHKKTILLYVSVQEIGVGNKCVTQCRAAIIHKKRNGHNLHSEEGGCKQEGGLWFVVDFFSSNTKENVEKRRELKQEKRKEDGRKCLGCQNM